ncbi:MAG: hypothetical protein QM785_17970 [Pyrinomonadaceae bacterium]
MTFWVLTVLSGVGVYWQYENRPGIAAAAPLTWPAESRIPRVEGRPTLIIAAHPQCPCTRATLTELSRLMNDNQGSLDAFVLFVKPAGASDGWNSGDAWEDAKKIAGVTVVHDELGSEAKIFDAHTSGQTMLFSSDGKLLFTGGITAGRGRRGVSAGESAISALLKGEKPVVNSTSVYGCPLFNDDAFCRVKTGAY